MDPVTIKAIRRAEVGKGPARRLRAAGMVPAVAYGKGVPNLDLAVSAKDVAALLKAEYGRNTVVELEVDGRRELVAMLGELQAHPVTQQLLHVDFVHISLDRPVDVEVELQLLGKPKGLEKGGVLRQVLRRVPVRCLPLAIPPRIAHDISGLDLHQHLTAADLVMPEGVSLRLPSHLRVASVVLEAKAGEKEEAPSGEAPAAPATPAAGEAKS